GTDMGEWCDRLTAEAEANEIPMGEGREWGPGEVVVREADAPADLLSGELNPGPMGGEEVVVEGGHAADGYVESKESEYNPFE
ncbi:hypothetical protein KIPB_002809, partial [Kipferlia bialata]